MYTESKKQNSAGHTLAEMAICICIVGLLMGGGMGGAARFFDAQAKKTAQHRIDLVLNVLSAYAQAHNRLPCPADPNAGPEKAGQEKCPTTTGLIPWKELELPGDMIADALGRDILYAPASALTTLRTDAATVDHALRSAAWYDSAGNHLNRAKAIFCSGGASDDKVSEIDMAATATTLATIEPAAGGANVTRKGDFSIPRYMEGPAAPLPAAPAVTLSVGNIKASLTAEQLYARAGSGSCAAPPAITRPYTCMPQNLSGEGGEITDAYSGRTIRIPFLYGVQVALAGDQFQLRAALTRNSDQASSHDSVGFYVIRDDGTIDNVQMPVPDSGAWVAGQTVDFGVAWEKNIAGIGVFLLPGGYDFMDGYKHADLSKLKFVSGDPNEDRKANIADRIAPALVAIDPATGAEVTLQGSGANPAWHLYKNLNPRNSNHLRSGTGFDPAHPFFAQFAFTDRPDDESKIAFRLAFAACPQKQ